MSIDRSIRFAWVMALVLVCLLAAPWARAAGALVEINEEELADAGSLKNAVDAKLSVPTAYADITSLRVTGGEVYATDLAFVRDSLSALKVLNLSGATIPNDIPDMMFGSHETQNTTLTDINVSAAASIGGGAFKNCSSLKTIDISSATSIEEESFKGCSTLTSIRIPAGMVRIGHNAFDGCSSLIRITFLGDTPPTSIGADAFRGVPTDIVIVVPANAAMNYLNLIGSVFPANARIEGAHAPTIDTTELPVGTMDRLYSQTLAASGYAGIEWSVDVGDLPDGLTLSTDGILSGVPTKLDTYEFTVKAVNAFGEDTQELSLTIESMAPRITTEALADGTVNREYSQTLAATGEAGIEWSVGGGDLPGGLRLAAGGILSGTPTRSGTYEFTVKAVNALGDDTTELSVTIYPAPIPVLTVTPATLTLEPGETGQLAASESGVTWTSSDEKTATVSVNGLVAAVAEGSATVTATTADGRTATCSVTVKGEPTPPEPVEGYDIGIEVLAVKKGKELILPVLKGYTGNWSVDNESVAKITKNGKRVKAVGLGTATLTFTVDEVVSKNAAIVLEDRKLKAGESYTIKFIVRKSGQLPTKITLDLKNLTLNTLDNAIAQLIATVKPAKALDREVIWTSSKPDVATVDQEGNVTAVAPGTTKITAATANLKQVTITVKVLGAVEKVKLNKSKQTIKVGETYQLTATVNADALDKTVVWTSGNTSVATVDENGAVTALKKGTAKITATAVNGKKATCTITVKKASAKAQVKEQTTQADPTADEDAPLEQENPAVTDESPASTEE